MNNAYIELDKRGITLPPVTAAAGAYAPFVQSNGLIFLSGHLARLDGHPRMGKLGKDLSTEDGIEAARQVAIDLIATLHAAVGDLTKVKRIIKATILVSSTEDFTEQHLVANGCSDLIKGIFGDAGVHARCAYGVSQIPLGACLEIDLIAEVDTPASR